MLPPVESKRLADLSNFLLQNRRLMQSTAAAIVESTPRMNDPRVDTFCANAHTAQNPDGSICWRNSLERNREKRQGCAEQRKSGCVGIGKHCVTECLRSDSM